MNRPEHFEQAALVLAAWRAITDRVLAEGGTWSEACGLAGCALEQILTENTTDAQLVSCGWLPDADGLTRYRG